MRVLRKIATIVAASLLPICGAQAGGGLTSTDAVRQAIDAQEETYRANMAAQAKAREQRRQAAAEAAEQRRASRESAGKSSSKQNPK